jgi:hypothetical protein
MFYDQIGVTSDGVRNFITSEQRKNTTRNLCLLGIFFFLVLSVSGKECKQMDVGVTLRV